MDLLTLALFALGLAILVAGAEMLVRGASRLATAIGISPVVVGLTIVAFGTSAPELAVSIQSAATGNADLAIGNVVGSNIFNVLFILGISALPGTLLVAQRLVRLDVPLMIALSILVLVLALDGGLGKLDGALLFSVAIVYTVWTIRSSRRETADIRAEYSAEFGPSAASTRSGWQFNVIFILIGLVLLVVGSNWLVNGAVEIASALGAPQLIVGLTIIAAGTSLPEVATSLTAAIRGERDIAVGNVVGSNIFNIISVLGLAALVSPSGIQAAASAVYFDIPVMIVTAVACLPIFFTGYSIARWEGALFLAFYAAYVVYLVLNATSHAALGAFSAAMLGFAAPLTILTLIVVVTRDFRSRRRTKGSLV
ncbi:MAG: calcium/sodium antiporter [Dehalococcoidia bacterium]